MGKIKPYLPVKLIMGVTVAAPIYWEQVQPTLVSHFSPIDMEMAWYPFTHTQYYRAEMGDNLLKKFVAFQQLIDAASLPDIKRLTNDIEQTFAEAQRRHINLDPGYICAPKLVLATTKDYSHRIYLRDGIFGDIHLKFLGKHFVPQEWTYPDYREPFVIEFFENVRTHYLTQLATVKPLSRE